MILFKDKKYLLLSMALLMMPVFSLQAEEVQREIYLDLDTMNRGFTVVNTDDQFKVGIRGGIFDEGAMVQIKNLNEDIEVPENKVKVSNAYSYDIKMEQPRVLDKTIFLQANYYPFNYNQPSFYFYNGVTGKWQLVPSVFNPREHYVRTELPFPYSKVVVFEDRRFSSKDLGIELDSDGALVVDAVSGAVLFLKDIDLVHPIASLTKLMTALVFLEHNPGWEKYVTIRASDQVGGSSMPFKVGEQVKVKDLYKSMLIGSANNSAQALARSTGYSLSGFVNLMNRKAQDLGLENTHYQDVTGLSSKNVSTPHELSKIAKLAFSKSVFMDVTSTPQYSFYTLASRYTAYTTNKMLYEDELDILASKTGHINVSGYNLVLKVRDEERDIIIVILGAPTRQASFDEAKLLAEKIK